MPGLRSVRVRDDVAYVGGGSLPDQAMKTCVVAIQPADISDTELAYRLRMGEPAIMGRLQGGKLLIDLRTVFPQQEDTLLLPLHQALAQRSG